MAELPKKTVSTTRRLVLRLSTAPPVEPELFVKVEPEMIASVSPPA
ncbi:MAG: hypothetical protein JRI55_27845 [Deltaproteobacteria bacterium]|nr:hypothetical protein [Deltaproteobacteria bacterium]